MSESTEADLTDGKNAIMAAFGARTSMQQVIVVDENIDAFYDCDAEWAVATRC